MAEAEQVFFNEPLLVIDDTKHSQGEGRFHALGKTNDDRVIAYYIHSAKCWREYTSYLSQRHAQKGAQDL